MIATATRPKMGADAICGPLEPFNDRTALRAEVSRRRRLEVGDVDHARTLPQILFDHHGGDPLGALLAAVDLYRARGLA